jgi:Protein of unknown function (DUF664)
VPGPIVVTMVTFAEPPPLPPDTLSDPRELLSGFLDFHRAAALRKLDGLPEEELRTSRLPSGWTPLEMLKHLAYVERRWMHWGFAGEPMDRPWGENENAGQDGRWAVGPDETGDSVRAFYLEQCEKSRRIAEKAELSQHAAAGGRFSGPGPAPTLIWIQFHLLQEYARHVGQLDVARELADGIVGE